LTVHNLCNELLGIDRLLPISVPLGEINPEKNSPRRAISTHRGLFIWWAIADLNCGPPACQADKELSRRFLPLRILGRQQQLSPKVGATGYRRYSPYPMRLFAIRLPDMAVACRYMRVRRRQWRVAVGSPLLIAVFRRINIGEMIGNVVDAVRS